MLSFISLSYISHKSQNTVYTFLYKMQNTEKSAEETV